MNLKFILNKKLKVSYVINSGRKHPVSCKHKESKRNCKFFLILAFLVSLPKMQTEISLDLCTKLHVIMKLYNFLKTSLLSLLKVDIPV